MADINKVKISETTYDLADTRIAIGTCPTAAGTATKVVTITSPSNWTLRTGAMISVKFTNTNTAASPKLNVNSTGAKSIYYNNAVYTSASSYGGYANRYITYQYDGTNWVFISWGYDSNSDTKATQTRTSTDKNYPVIFAYSDGDKDESQTVRKNLNFTYNPSKKAISMGRISNTAEYTPGESSVALGEGVIATGNYSVALGQGTIASGESSYAEGMHTAGEGIASHAEGSGSIASGEKAHAEGHNTVAEGYASHAEGWSTSALGAESHAEGMGTIATRYAQHVQGAYNIEDINDNYLHIVGNGLTAETPSNAHTLDWNGNAWFKGNVYVGSTSGTNKDTGSKKLATEDQIPTVPSSLKNPTSLTVKGNGTTSFTYDGSAAKTLNIKAGTNTSVSSDTSGNITINVPTASDTVTGATVVYPAAKCTTFSSDSGTVTPLAVQKGAELFAITRPPKRSTGNPANPGAAGTCTTNNIVRWLNTDGDVQDSKITIEDVTNTRDTSKKAQVIAIPAEGDKKMVYGYCTDQVDGTSFIGGVFANDATEYPYNQGLAIGGTSGNLLWKGKQVATTDMITADTKNTTGTTDTSSKIYLAGATSQAANPQTYSHNTVYVDTDGHLYSNSKQAVNLSDTQALTNKTYNGYTLGAACAKGVATSVASGNTNLVTSGGVYSTTSTLAPKASPALTGTPTAPTAAAGTNTTQIATTAFVKTALDNKITYGTTDLTAGTSPLATGAIYLVYE